MKFQLLNTFLNLLLLFVAVLCEHDEDNWIESNAWAREKHDLSLFIDGETTLAATAAPECSMCASDDGVVPSDDAMALIYYKKFIANLFSRQKLKYNREAAIYERVLLFTLLPTQLEQLEQLSNPRDLDSVLTEIFSKARTPSTYAYNDEKTQWSKRALVWDILKDFAKLLKISEVRFLLLAAAAVLLCWFLHRRYKMGFITILVGGIFIYGYLFTYLECNRKMEEEQMLAVLESQKRSVPDNTPHWYSPLLNLFGYRNPTKEAHKQSIRKSTKLNLGFCRPDHVLMMYANEMFLKQLELLIEKCTDTFISVKENLPFPFNYIASVLLVCMIGYILKLTFKYILSPRAWASLLHLPKANIHNHQPLPPTTSGVHAINVNEDRISGENLKLLLHRIKGPTVVVHSTSAVMSTLPLASGVQEILEQLEAPTDAGILSVSSKSNASNTSVSEAQESPISNNNNESNEKITSVLTAAQ